MVPHALVLVRLLLLLLLVEPAPGALVVNVSTAFPASGTVLVSWEHNASALVGFAAINVSVSAAAKVDPVTGLPVCHADYSTQGGAGCPTAEIAPRTFAGFAAVPHADACAPASGGELFALSTGFGTVCKAPPESVGHNWALCARRRYTLRWPLLLLLPPLFLLLPPPPPLLPHLPTSFLW